MLLLVNGVPCSHHWDLCPDEICHNNSMDISALSSVYFVQIHSLAKVAFACQGLLSNLLCFLKARLVHSHFPGCPEESSLFYLLEKCHPVSLAIHSHEQVSPCLACLAGGLDLAQSDISVLKHKKSVNMKDVALMKISLT